MGRRTETWVISPEDLSASWLQDALSARYPGVRVAHVQVTSIHEMTNTHVRVSLTYEHAAGAPDRVFVKLPPLDPRRRQLLGASGMGQREARFYQLLAPHLKLRVPTPHAVCLEQDGGFAMVLEDLTASGCEPYDGIVGVTADAAAVALEDLAAMHVRFEDSANRQDESVSWIRPPKPPKQRTDGPDVGERLLRRGIDEHRERLGEAYVAVGEVYITQRRGLVDAWTDAPATVIHGDLHLGNLFSDHGRVGFFDWGIITLADPMRDVSYFLCMALDVDVRRAQERDLMRTYLEARAALGGRELGWDEAWSRHRIQSAYTVPASCQAIRVPAAADAQTHAFAEAFLGRAMAAVTDLEAPAALAAAGLEVPR
jgi:hypothetical protein